MAILWATDQVPDINYVVVVRAFPRVKSTSCLKCEWEDFTDEEVGGARRKVRIFDSMTPRAYASSSPADLSAYRTGVYFVHPSNGLWTVETLVV
jgi:hypothetical protein